jgi:acetyltransferase-like isoleucine patch superfamily enzyme
VFSDDLTNLVLRLPSAIAMRFRRAWLSALGARIGRNCWLPKVLVPRNPWDVALGDYVALDRYVVLLSSGPRKTEPRISIGARTYVNRFTMIDASERVTIGERCMVGPHCYITDHDHGFRPGVPVGDQPLVSRPVTIGNDVWLGAGAIILKGVTIGDGAVVAAGSVVTKAVAPQSKVAGVPARLLGTRQDV